MTAGFDFSLPRDFAAELERKFFWLEPVGARPRSDLRIVAQAMKFALFADVRRLETVIGPERLVTDMRHAEPGWIDARSWEFWRGRLTFQTGL